jgi:hypothetical protein
VVLCTFATFALSITAQTAMNSLLKPGPVKARLGSQAVHLAATGAVMLAMGGPILKARQKTGCASFDLPLAGTKER